RLEPPIVGDPGRHRGLPAEGDSGEGLAARDPALPRAHPGAGELPGPLAAGSLRRALRPPRHPLPGSAAGTALRVAGEAAEALLRPLPLHDLRLHGRGPRGPRRPGQTEPDPEVTAPIQGDRVKMAPIGGP